MKLKEILYKGGVREGSSVVMMPSYYKWENIGSALTELGARGIFVDHDIHHVLKKARQRFPSCGAVRGDALSFHAYGIDTAVHVRGIDNYPHGTEVIITERSDGVAIGTVPYDGFDEMVRNAYRISPNFVLLSFQDTGIHTEEMSALEKAAFSVADEGECEDLNFSDGNKFRYTIAQR